MVTDMHWTVTLGKELLISYLIYFTSQPHKVSIIISIFLRGGFSDLEIKHAISEYGCLLLHLLWGLHLHWSCSS